jgi:hypothetical protein
MYSGQGVNGSKMAETAVAAPLSLPRRSRAKAGRGATGKTATERRNYSPSGIYKMASR